MFQMWMEECLAMEEEKIRIPSSFGKLSAVINYNGKKEGKLAILCPGYLNSKDYEDLAGLALALAEHGYTAIRFNPTGTWDSEGDISQYNSTQYLKDIGNVLDYMLGLSHFKRILIGGHSRGGDISLIYAARDSRVSCAVAIMPGSKRATLQAKNDDWEKTGFQKSYRDIPGQKDKNVQFDVPLSQLEDYLKYDVEKEVGKVHVPVIFIAGELDSVCPVGTIREIFNRSNEPKRFVIIPGVGHDYRRNANEVRMVNAAVIRLMDELGIL